jgi:hypothetical protein
MSYVVKMRMSIIKEIEVIIHDPTVDVVAAMDIADNYFNNGPIDNYDIISQGAPMVIQTTNWAPVSVEDHKA